MPKDDTVIVMHLNEWEQNVWEAGHGKRLGQALSDTLYQAEAVSTDPTFYILFLIAFGSIDGIDIPVAWAEIT